MSYPQKCSTHRSTPPAQVGAPAALWTWQWDVVQADMMSSIDCLPFEGANHVIILLSRLLVSSVSTAAAKPVPELWEKGGG